MAGDNHKILKDFTGQQMVAALRTIGAALKPKGAGVVYGFRINANESEPTASVTYTRDAWNMLSASMDFSAGTFDYGTWKDAFFMPRPCMLKYDGTVDYYLSETDYTKREDGSTASDVADTAYEGNAMMEWGRDGKIIWYKVIPSEDKQSCEVLIADHQEDDGFVCWPFVNAKGEIGEHFYTPIYNGTVVNGKLRSMSGLSWETYGCKSKTAQQERDLARANGAGWDTEVYCDVILVNLLLTLISKSLASQTKFGEGLSASGSDTVNNGFTTGVHNAKGLFFGTNSGAAATYTNAVKVFGMENWWGFQCRRFGGLVNDNGTMRYKLTHSQLDGSGVGDYVISTSATDYRNYLDGGSLPAASVAYIQKMEWGEDGSYTPTAAAGTATTYYCDGLWTNNRQVDYAFHGGGSGDGLRVGAWSLNLRPAAGLVGWFVGAAPSCKPQS